MYSTPIPEVGKVQFEYENILHKVKGQLNIQPRSQSYWLPQIPYSSRNYFLENSFILNKDEGLCESLQVMLCKFLMICIIHIDAGLLA
jgi:hypothetical protein